MQAQMRRLLRRAGLLRRARLREILLQAEVRLQAELLPQEEVLREAGLLRGARVLRGAGLRFLRQEEAMRIAAGYLRWAVLLQEELLRARLRQLWWLRWRYR